ncbi:hypothetical protein ACWESM_14250 [Nocardia sp. NPDC003999]|uniref:hypothetical protein n=2 Tax=Nocardiaceae TaxID=85025 RepID=UPI00379D4C2A
MMRTPLRLAAASVAAATLVVTAAGATAEPISSAPATAVAAGTGSSAVDSGAAAAQSAVYFLQRGDVIGILVLLVTAPLQIFTSGVCDLATGSALPSPCATPR